MLCARPANMDALDRQLSLLANGTVTSLDLGGNDIRAQGAERLATALEQPLESGAANDKSASMC